LRYYDRHSVIKPHSVQRALHTKYSIVITYNVNLKKNNLYEST